MIHERDKSFLVIHRCPGYVVQENIHKTLQICETHEFVLSTDDSYIRTHTYVHSHVAT